ncbi:MAG: hypothetical protein ACRC78_01535 [Planktothrix sp.]
MVDISKLSIDECSNLIISCVTRIQELTRREFFLNELKNNSIDYKSTHIANSIKEVLQQNGYQNANFIPSDKVANVIAQIKQQIPIKKKFDGSIVYLPRYTQLCEYLDIASKPFLEKTLESYSSDIEKQINLDMYCATICIAYSLEVRAYNASFLQAVKEFKVFQESSGFVFGKTSDEVVATAWKNQVLSWLIARSEE